MSVARVHVLQPSISGRRLDQLLAEQVAGLSRTYAKQLIESGRVLVDGQPARPSHAVQVGERIRVEIPPPAPSALLPEAMPLSIVYEDEDMLVLDKPAGIAVHPGPGHAEHTLVHALLARYPDLPGIGGTQRPGIVHRLDLETSGLLMVAKTGRGQNALSAQLASRTVHKGYLALLLGGLGQERGAIDAPIGRDPSGRQRMAVVASGREARTRFVRLAQLAQHTLVLALPETGRMHQIRVHFAALGHPLVGDRLYGGELGLVPRHFLHASLLRFALPSNGMQIEVQSPLPEDLLGPLCALLAQSGDRGTSIDAGIERMLALAVQEFHAEAGRERRSVHAPRPLQPARLSRRER